MGPKLLYFFVIGDILGTGIYALTGSVAGKVGGALWLPFLAGVRRRVPDRVRLPGTGRQVPTGRGRRAVHQPRVQETVPDLPGRVRGDVLGHHVGVGRGPRVRRHLPAAPRSTSRSPTDDGRDHRGGVHRCCWRRSTSSACPHSVKANVVLTCIELSGLAIIIGVGVFAVGRRRGRARPADARSTPRTPAGCWRSPRPPRSRSSRWSASRTRSTWPRSASEPARIFPKALLCGLATAAVIYVLVAITSSLLVAARRTGGRRVRRAAQGDRRRRARLPALGLRVDRRVRGHQLGADQHADGEPAAVRHGERAHPAEDLRHRAPVPPHAVGVDPASPAASRSCWSSTAGNDGVGKLGGTTALLLLCVFTVVNIAVLVLRKEKVEHKHFTAPTWAPVLGRGPVPVPGDPGAVRPPGERLLHRAASCSASASCCGS